MNPLFEKQMRDLLKTEADTYFACLNQPAKKGFRINTLKGDADQLFGCLSISHEKSRFADNGYYTDAKAGIGHTPEYMAGAFYMQEPSASSAVTVLKPLPGMKVLDLCAAPGSKSTQIGEMMKNQGLLVVNEINSQRARILLENIERHGITNAVVTNCDTKVIADTLEEYFDMVLCDAPCSGEGMMRKENEAISQWSPKLVESCAALQKEILSNAYRCLKPGGTLVYSTCTLNKVENEQQVLSFLQNHPDMHMCDAGVNFGRCAFETAYDIDKAIRIFPMDEGEGHFVAKMKKDGTARNYDLPVRKSDVVARSTKQVIEDTIEVSYPYMFASKARVYGSVNPFYDFGKIHVLRQGVLLGEEKKGRFEFSHHFFMSTHSHFRNSFSMNEAQCRAYMHGEQITADSHPGMVAMCYHGYVIGGAKSDGRVMKNRYPKAFRTR